ncbi:formylglycine-generating enzyme family protein [Myxococcota bacterium]|nr:formylglycine-generating enzyme family protein [Myxococcota bacterium]
MILLSLLWACSSQPVDRPSPGCPADMARVEGQAGPFCIHRHELRVEGDLGAKDQSASWPAGQVRVRKLVSAPGQDPSRGLSWYQAHAACRAAGMSLCTSQQWEDACDGQPGPGGREHPTATGALEATDCNINHPGTHEPALTGSSPRCRTPEGVYDLEGNLWEWTDPGRTGDDGLPLIDKRGGGHYSGDIAPCSKAAIGSHPPAFDGSIGFRCCQPVSG